MTRRLASRFALAAAVAVTLLTLSTGCRALNWVGSVNVVLPIFGGQGGFLSPFQTAANNLIAAITGGGS